MTNDTRAAFEAWLASKRPDRPLLSEAYAAGYLASRRATLEEVEKLKTALEEIANNDEECQWTADGLSWVAKKALSALAEEGMKL